MIHLRFYRHEFTVTPKKMVTQAEIFMRRNNEIDREKTGLLRFYAERVRETDSQAEKERRARHAAKP